MSKVHNFSAGPSILNQEVIKKAIVLQLTQNFQHLGSFLSFISIHGFLHLGLEIWLHLALKFLLDCLVKIVFHFFQGQMGLVLQLLEQICIARTHPKIILQLRI